jgi:hypothetical protein
MIADATAESIKRLSDQLRDLKRNSTLEEAARKCVSLCYDEFRDAVVLVRLFATVDFGKLPAGNKKFVRQLAEAKGVGALIKDNTPVLSLLATRGSLPDWNDRRRSQGHAGIPLVSASFAESIPMISRLLKELGFKLDWIDERDTKIVGKVLAGGLAGVFHVADARHAVDHQGRHIIAAQDFVTAHNVRTVFGVGGSYMNGTLMTLIFFTREEIDRSQTSALMPLANLFKAATLELVMNGKIFSPEPA